MAKFTTTYQGKPFDEADFGDDTKKLILGRLRDNYLQKLTGTLTDEEAEQVRIDFNENEAGNVCMSVHAPEEIKAKINEGLSASDDQDSKDSKE